MAGKSDPPGVRALTDEVISKESTPIFDDMINTKIGGELADICEKASWHWPVEQFAPWNIDYSLYEVNLPPLTMSEAVHLIADRIHALSTPTDLYPIVETQGLIGAGVGR